MADWSDGVSPSCTVGPIGHCLYPAKFTYLVGGDAVPSVIRLMFTSVVNVVVMAKVQYYFQYVFSLDR